MIKWIKNQLTSYKETGQIPYIFAVLIPFHTLAIYGIFSTTFTTSTLYMLFAGWVIFCGYGTVIMLHKYFAHKSFSIYKILKVPLYWIACMAGQGSPIWWAAQHRGLHHAHADTDKDLHSPIHGFWHAYMGWMFKITHKSVSMKYASDLLRDKMIITFHKQYNKIIWGSIVLLIVIDPTFTLLTWFYIIPVLIGLHIDSQVNSLCHSTWIGYRTYQTKEDSRNLAYLGWLGWGQGWHNNHHSKPSSFDFGTSISGKRFEFDPGLLLLPVICPINETIRIWKNWGKAWQGG